MHVTHAQRAGVSATGKFSTIPSRQNPSGLMQISSRPNISSEIRTWIVCDRFACLRMDSEYLVYAYIVQLPLKHFGLREKVNVMV